MTTSELIFRAAVSIYCAGLVRREIDETHITTEQTIYPTEAVNLAIEIAKTVDSNPLADSCILADRP